jgi:hypothetical protein
MAEMREEAALERAAAEREAAEESAANLPLQEFFDSH